MAVDPIDQKEAHTAPETQYDAGFCCEGSILGENGKDVWVHPFVNWTSIDFIVCLDLFVYATKYSAKTHD